jgi:hypothetical protein
MHVGGVCFAFLFRNATTNGLRENALLFFSVCQNYESEIEGKKTSDGSNRE